jgi:hypothetical protein
VVGPNNKACSLHDLLEQSPAHRLWESDVRRWAKQVAEALAYAHGQGVVHRDIKPANVLVDRDNNARVADFGLAKAVGEEWLQSQIHASVARSLGSMKTLMPQNRTESSLGDEKTVGSDRPSGPRSSADALLGTYDYMAPEQRGDLDVPISPATDVYAFGVMFYRLLTGRRPSGMAKPVSQVVPGLSTSWDAIIARCLEHYAKDRYADGAALVEALLEQGRRDRGEEPADRAQETGDSGQGTGFGVQWAVDRLQSLGMDGKRWLWLAGAVVGVSILFLRPSQSTSVKHVEPVRAPAVSAQEAEQRKKFQELTAPADAVQPKGTNVPSSVLHKRSESAAGEREMKKRYLTASLARGKVLQIDRGQGFGERLDALELTWLEAEAARRKGAWDEARSGYDEVITACKELEESEAAREAAKVQKSEAEKNRYPSVLITATVNGMEVKAEAVFAGERYSTPLRMPLKKDATYEGLITCAYRGRKYKNFLSIQADWTGERKVSVPLNEAREPVEGTAWTSPSTGMAFVWIEALRIWVGKYEVTNGEYRKKEAGHDSKVCKGQSLNGDLQPVVYVTFDDAKAYAAWLTVRDKKCLDGLRYRVISETEWQTCAQCGDGRGFPWGNTLPPRHGNYCGQETKGLHDAMIAHHNDGYEVTCVVERSGKNDWGIFGMGGNVWECCAVDATGETFGAWRGGAWNMSYPDFLRSSYRSDPSGALRSNDSRGFRLVLSQ